MHLTICSKGNLLATFADPFNSTIYNHSSIAIHSATTKIPHLLYEKDLPKTPNLIYLQFMIYLQGISYDGNGRKTQNTIKAGENFTWMNILPILLATGIIVRTYVRQIVQLIINHFFANSSMLSSIENDWIFLFYPYMRLCKVLSFG